MKSIAYSVIVILCTCTDLFPVSLPDSTSLMPGVRNIPWNSSIEKVREQESTYYLQKFTGFGLVTLSYKDKIAGIDSRVDYTFKNDKLTEGAFIISHDDSFKDHLTRLLEYLTKQFGSPEYRSGPAYTSETVWIKENNYGSFLGPSFYWIFSDGFIALISQKFESNVTLSVLFAHGSSMARYAENNGVELSEFKFIPVGKQP